METLKDHWMDSFGCPAESLKQWPESADDPAEAAVPPAEASEEPLSTQAGALFFAAQPADLTGW